MSSEPQLVDQQTLMRSLYQTSADCIKVLDPDGRILSANAAACRKLRVDAPDQVLGHLWHGLWKEAQADDLLAAMAKARDGEVGSFIAPTYNDDGSELWWYTIVTAVTGPNGVATGLLAVSRDITPIKSAEAALRRSVADLERLVDEKTGILSDVTRELRTERLLRKGTQAMPIQTQKMLALGQTAGEFRLAWNATRYRGVDELVEEIEKCGLLLVYVAADEAKASRRAKPFAKAVNRQKRALKEGFAVVDRRGIVTRIDQRVTGDLWEEIQKRLEGINRDELVTVAQAREVMREANREAWANAREQARPASWIESRIADCGHMEGRRISGADALAARSETDRLEANRRAAARDWDLERPAPVSQSATVYGAEAFAARLFATRLDDIGIVIARVTAADERAFDALRPDEDRKRTAAETNRESYQGNRFAEVLPGEIVAVTRNGDVYQINPAKLGDAAKLLPDTLPGVVEARAALTGQAFIGQVANIKAGMESHVSKPFSLIAAVERAAGAGARNPFSAGDINGPRRTDHHILVVDDVADVLVTVGAFLMKEGFAVQKASTGDEALRLIADDPRIDVLVSDFAMPGLSGTELIAQAVQMRPNLKALVITGYPNADGLADLPPHTTILAKPFRRDTLIARIRSLLDEMQPVANENPVELTVRKKE